MSGPEYQKRQEGNTTVFDVTPAPMKKFMLIVVLGGIGALLGLMTLHGAGIFGYLFVAGCGYAVYWAWTHDLRPLEYRSPATFKVTPDTIEAKGQTWKKADIHRLIIRNGITKNIVAAPVMVEVAPMTAAGAAHRMQVSLTANGLEVESGGKATVLAGGMDEVTAFGLLSDVSRVLGFATSS